MDGGGKWKVGCLEREKKKGSGRRKDGWAMLSRKKDGLRGENRGEDGKENRMKGMEP